MKKITIFITLIYMGFSLHCLADYRIKQASPAVYADMELPFRCMPEEVDKQISKTIVLTPDDFSFLPVSRGDSLPRYSVNGYSFHREPANKVLSKLLSSAGIQVVAPKSEYALLSGHKVTGELSSVVADLAEMGEVFYSYNAATKRLVLLRRGDYVLMLPKYRPVVMTVLDALRGSGLENLNVDWERYQIRMTVSPEELQKAKKLVQQMLDNSSLLVADIQVFQAIPYLVEGSWQQVLNDSLSLVSSLGRSVVGRSVVLRSKADTELFLNKVRHSFQLNSLVMGQAFVPNGWRMRFDVGECARQYSLPFSDLSIVMKTKIQNETQENTQVTLHTSAGVLSTFNVNSDLNQEVVLLGIPSKVGNAELLFTLKFGLVRFIQKGE